MRGRVSLAVGLLLALSVFPFDFPFYTDSAQGARAATWPGTGFDGRWGGSLEKDYGAKCGRGFSVGIHANFRGQTIEGTLSHLNKEWKFKADVESDGSFKIWTPFELFSGFLEAAVDGQLELKGNVSTEVDGTFYVHMARGSWDCGGTFYLFHLDPPPTTVAADSDAGGGERVTPMQRSAESASDEIAVGTNVEAKVETRTMAKAVSRVADKAPEKPETATAPTAAASQMAIDLAFWNSIKSSANPEVFQAYL